MGGDGEVAELMLDNGMKVLLKEMHASPVVSVFVWFKVGSKDERPGITGVSHWVEHMMFQGTPRFGKGEHFKRIAAIGGMLNGFTSHDFTAYFETVPAAHADLVLDMEADRLRSAAFVPDEVERERTVIISEREGAENNPIYVMYEETQAIMYRNHPYRWPVVGWKDDLKKMTREDLYGYYQLHYSPSNSLLVVTGDLGRADMEARVRKFFGPLTGPKAPAFSCPPELPQVAERRVTVRGPKGSPYMIVGYHGPLLADEDAPAAIVLDAILSGAKPLSFSSGGYLGKSSRIYDALVRRKKVAAAAGSSYFPSDQPSSFSFSVAVQQGVKPEKAEKALDEEIERVREKPVADTELKKALRQVRAQLEYSRDGVTANAYMLGRFEMLGSHRLLDELLKRLEGVTAGAVKAVAEKCLKPENRTVGLYLPEDPKPQKPAAAPKAEKKPQAPAGGGGTPAGTGVAPCVRKDLTASMPQDPDLVSTGWSPWADGAWGADAPVLAARPIQRRQLGNGVVALVLENPESHSIVLQGSLKAGLAYEAPAKSGTASLTTRLMTRGTAKRGSKQIAEALESRGSSMDFWCGDESVGFGGKCLEGEADRLLGIFAECLRGPAFPQGELDAARGQMLTELRHIEDNPDQMARRAIVKMLYPEGHAYHRLTVENAEQIQTLGREDCEAYYKRLFGPETLVVVLVGRLKADRAFDLIAKAVGDWTGAKAPPPPAVPPIPPGAERRKAIKMEKKSQNELYMAQRAIPRSHADYYALSTANHILGRLGLMGRLGDRVRDKMGLAYGVHSALNARLWDGEWLAAAGINPQNLAKAEEAIVSEMKKLLAEGVTAQELADAQENLVGSMPIRLETNNGLAGLVHDIEHNNLGLDYREKYPGIIRALTREALVEAARKHLDPEKLLVAVAGP